MRMRSSGKRDGFLLIDTLIAAAIVFSGLAALVSLLPKLMEVYEKRVAIAEMTNYGVSKQQELMSVKYSSILPQASGNLNDLMGSTFPGISAYSWEYKSTETLPDALKRVELSIRNNSLGVNSDSFIFYIAAISDGTI